MIHSIPETGGRQAVVYIPGLTGLTDDQSALEVARRLAGALNRQACTGEAAFLVGEVNDESYDGGKTQLVTISRQDGTQIAPIIDLYTFDYIDTLLNPFRKSNVAYQTLSLAVTLLSNTGRFLSSIRRPYKTTVEKFQYLFVLLLYLMMGLYMLLLITTLVATAIDAIASLSGVQSYLLAQIEGITSGTIDLQQMHLTPRWLYYLQVFTVVTTALGLFTKFDIKQTLGEASAQMASMINYLSLGENVAVINGKFAGLLEHIIEKKVRGLDYAQVHVISFSFGSVIAIDTIFPIYPIHGRINRIHTLVTIGCPFDMIRGFFPKHFTNRCGLPGIPARWINIYETADVLGSNFLDDGDQKEEPKARGVELDGGEARMPVSIRFGKARKLEEYGSLERLALVGLQNHMRYWARGTTCDINCFDTLVTQMYGDSVLLG